MEKCHKPSVSLPPIELEQFKKPSLSLANAESAKSIELSVSYNNKPIIKPRLMVNSYSVTDGKQNIRNLNSLKMRSISIDTNGEMTPIYGKGDDDGSEEDPENDQDTPLDTALDTPLDVPLDLSAMEPPSPVDDNLHSSPRSLRITSNYNNYLHSPPRSRRGSTEREPSISKSKSLSVDGIPKLRPKLSITYSNSKILNDETNVKRKYCCTCCCTKTGKNLWILARNEYDHFIKYKYN